MTEGYVTHVHADGPDKPIRDEESHALASNNKTRLDTLQAKVLSLEAAHEYLNSSDTWFGFRVPIGNSNSAGEPVGNLFRLKHMQEIFKIGGYMVKNDHSRKKLHPSDHRYYEDGSPVDFTGAHGHYQWGWGVGLWYASWSDNNYKYEAFDDRRIPGVPCVYIPVGSRSCSGYAALDRTNNILVNYCNRTAQYRGGTNVADVDTAWNTQLGKPVINVAENSLQRYAEKNGARWGATMYMVVFMVGALMRIVFHNRNIQKSYNAAKTADGLFQGGLGMGVDDVNGSFNNQYATLDIDALADKGDAMGVFSYDCKDGDTVKLTIRNIPSFFGLKNFYHYLWMMLHGVNIVYTADGIQVWAIQKWTGSAVPTDDTTGMRLIGTIPAASKEGWEFVKRMNLAHMMMFPLEIGGSESTYYGDGIYRLNITSGLRGLLALGAACYGGSAGSGCLFGSNGPGDAWADYGAAVCEAAEDWNTEPFWVD